MSHARPTARSEQLRQAVQLASLASLEDVVTHGQQSLLQSSSRLVAPDSSVEQAQSVARLQPRSRSRSPLPKAAPGRPRGSILLSQRGPTLSVKAAPRLLPTARFLGTATLALRPPLLAVASLPARTVRPAPLLRPSLAPRLLNPEALQKQLGRLVEVALLAPLRLGVARVTSTAGGHDVTPNARCGEILCQDLSCCAMWPCCADSSSDDDDEHNTDNDALLLFGHAIVEPVLQSRLSALDELSFALTCQFALDVFIVIQQDYPEIFEELTVLDVELEEVA